MYIISIIRVVQVHRVSGNVEAQNWYVKVFDFLQTLTPKHLSDLNQVGFLFRSLRLDKTKALAGKSFHLDTCCFDSVPEQYFFLNVISQDDIKEVNFTGMLTPARRTSTRTTSTRKRIPCGTTTRISSSSPRTVSGW